MIPQSAGYQRFCSNFVVGSEHGFDRELLLTNEELATSCFGRRTPAPARRAADRDRRRAGRRRRGLRREERRLQVALRPGPAQPRERRGHSRLRLPGRALATTRSTLRRPSSTCTAPQAADFWDDDGTLHSSRTRRRSTTMATSQRRCRPSPATSSRSRLRSRPASSTDARSRPRTSATRAAGRDSERSQWVLETWSNQNNVFQFIRVEDIAYDRRPGMAGSYTSPTRVSPARSRTRRPAGCAEVRPGPRAAPNGRIWKLDARLEPAPGRRSTSSRRELRCLGYRNANAVHQPDNVETTSGGSTSRKTPARTTRSPRRSRRDERARVALQPRRGSLTSLRVNQAVGRPGPEPRGVGVERDRRRVLDLRRARSCSTCRRTGGTRTLTGGNDAPAVPKREHGQLLLLRAPELVGGDCDLGSGHRGAARRPWRPRGAARRRASAASRRARASRPPRRGPERVELLLEPASVDGRAGEQQDRLVARRRDGLRLRPELLVELLPGRAPTNSMSTSVPGSFPERRIIVSARSTMRTGSPMSRTYTWPRPRSRPPG